MKQFEIPGQVAVITGAARGIGLAAAQLLAEAGATGAVLGSHGCGARSYGQARVGIASPSKTN